jgi:hypothetical protein
MTYETATRRVAWAAVATAMSLLSLPAIAAPSKVPEGSEMRIRFEDTLSSKSAVQGDQFTITLAEEVRLPDGAILRPGYRGVGEVTNVEKRGMLGKGGQLNVRFNYIKVGDTRIRLRGNRGAEGKDAVGATVALTVLFGPIGLIKKGKDVEIPAGQEMTVYVDDDTEVQLAASDVAAASAPAPVAPASAPPAVAPPAPTAVKASATPS